MATGRLGNVALATNNTNNLVYTSPSGYYSVFNVSITNTTTSSVTFRVAISTASTAGGVATAEYIEYDTVLQAKGVFERTGLVTSAASAPYVWVQASVASGINVTVYGIETSTA
jgi:hypothetical protein